MSETSSSPVFLKTAEDLARRLDAVGSPEGQELGKEARELAASFRDWLTNRPSDDVRAATLQRLFDLHRRALEFLSKRLVP